MTETNNGGISAPSLFTTNSLPFTSNITSMVTAASLPVEANTWYEVSIGGIYQTTSALQGLRLGIDSTATGITCMLSASINLQASGSNSGTMFAPMDSLSTILQGLTSVNGVDQNFHINGKILTSSVAGTFSVQIGAGSVLSTLTIPADRLGMMLRKLP